MEEIRAVILREIEQIKPFDDTEQESINYVSNWIKSGVEIFRIGKPDKPPIHLVSYFVLIDKKNKSLLLVDHIKAQLWLPSGGHVEVNENPKVTVDRESVEELGKAAKYLNNYEHPFFITIAKTVGLTAGHTDVSLWYLLDGDMSETLTYDKSEFKSIKWFKFEEVLRTPISQLDPNLHRFVNKLNAYIKNIF
jgi:8-oxo-dGTP pyrophosphatase MutT (NUDIX family)